MLHKLTDAKIKSIKANGKLQRFFDGGGLFLLVSATGKKGWRWKYRFRGREGLLSFGIFPDVTLKSAREKHRQARSLLADGKNPSAERKAAKLAHLVTFKQVADRYLDLKAHDTTFTTQSKHIWFISLLRDLHNRSVDSITTPELIGVLKRIAAKGHHETAQRCGQMAGRVFRYAIQEGRLTHNPASNLREVLPAVKTKHHAAVTDPVKVGALLRALDGYEGYAVVQSALKIAPLVFVRPAELRKAEWKEFDLDKAEWRIASERMKMGRPHFVPLSTQTVALLRDLHDRTGGGRLVFPCLSANNPLSDNSLTSALRRMGYTKAEMTWHGFRTTASTLLNELGWESDLIELQLAHDEPNKVRAAYNRAERLPERRKMVQAYADYLDVLRATVVPAL